MKKQTKALLGVAIAICFLVSADRIYKFYKAHTPPFAIGECFSVTEPQIGTVHFKVIDNDRKAARTAAVGTIEFMPGVKIQIPINASFEQIRSSNPSKEECEK